MQNKLLQAFTLSIIIPAYNEEDGIAEIISRILSIRPSIIQANIKDVELIIVDDGSSDTTAEIISKFPDVKLYQHTTNLGYGAALKTGFSSANGDLLAFSDADGTYPPEYFPLLCAEVINGADLVVGSRRLGKETEMPFLRKIGNIVWSTLITILSGRKISDPASGMRVFKKSILNKLYPLPDGLNFTPVMSLRAAHEDIIYQEVPIPYKERLGNSKLNVLQDGLRFLQTILWTSLNYNPVQIFGALGFGMLLASVLIFFGILILRITGITSLGVWGVALIFTGMLLAVSGVDLFALGVTFNYLVSLFQQKPIRKSLFGKPVFRTPLEDHFWWVGILTFLLGITLGIISIVLALESWQIERLWFYLLGSAMLILIGLQLFVFWVIVQILDELNTRNEKITNDLEAKKPESK